MSAKPQDPARSQYLIHAGCFHRRSAVRSTLGHRRGTGRGRCADSQRSRAAHNSARNIGCLSLPGSQSTLNSQLRNFPRSPRTRVGIRSNYPGPGWALSDLFKVASQGPPQARNRSWLRGRPFVSAASSRRGSGRDEAPGTGSTWGEGQRTASVFSAALMDDAFVPSASAGWRSSPAASCPRPTLR